MTQSMRAVIEKESQTDKRPTSKGSGSVLLTNDDGCEAEGLVALWKSALLIWGTGIQVVAPARCWSGMSHATITNPDRPIRVDEIDHELLEGWVVDGYPADCIRLALRGIGGFQGEPPPLVLSGINPGANVGMDIYYSGTVAAAREAVAFGCPAVALSQLTYKKEPNDWDKTVEWATLVLERLIPFIQQDKPVLWNINFPRTSEAKGMPKIRVVPIATDPLAVSYFPPVGENPGYVYNGSYFDRKAEPGTDVGELFAGHITVTPLGLDPTVREFLE